MSDEILVGDYVSFTHSAYGYREGVVVGSRTEYPTGRKVVEVEIDPGRIYQAWYPTVRLIRRVQYALPPPTRKTTIERTVYW